MKAIHRILLRWYRARLLGYRPIYDNAYAEARLGEIHHALRPFLTHTDEVVRYTAASRAHYIAQSYQRSLLSRMVLEFLCILVLAPALCYWCLRAPRARPAKMSAQGIRLAHSQEALAVFHLPPELEACRQHSFIPTKRYLRAADIKLLAHVAWLSLGQLRARLQDGHIAGAVQYWLKLAHETARLRPVLDAYATPYITVYAEYDCSISYQTLLCHRDGTLLYNVIHGDHLVGMNDPFFHVDRCYVWHVFYSELFARQYVQADFRLFENPNFSMTEEEARHIPNGIGVAMPHPIYSSSSTAYAAELKALATALNTLATTQAVTLRPHPLYPEHYAQIRPFLSDAIAVSNAHTEPARAFIVRHATVMGVYSALLIEAAMMGRKVIAFENDITRQIAQYHFFFTLDNVQLQPTETLTQACA